MHIDTVTENPDGSLTIVVSTFMNDAVAASYAGAAVSGSVAVAGAKMTVTFTLTPSAPVVEPAPVTY